MKTADKYRILRSFFAALAATALTGSLAANEPRVFTVDNTGGPHADFTDLQEAMDAAVDGDTFHVLGSPIGYGDIVITRRVHLFGPGYNLPRVYDEGYQDFHEAALGTVEFVPTRTFNPLQETSPAGSSMEGFRTGAVYISASDITVKRNRLDSLVRVQQASVDGDNLEVPHRTHILQNYMNGFQISNSRDTLSATGHVAANNIMRTGSSFMYNGMFRHNTVMDGSFSSRLYAENATVENNTLWGVDAGSRNTLIRNNIVYQEEPEDGEFLTENTFADNQWNFQENRVWDTLFVNEGAFDEQYQLAEGSPAEGAGFEGVDIGAFDGPFPYEISGVSPLPRVKIMAPGPFMVSPNSDLTIPVRIEVE